MDLVAENEHLRALLAERESALAAALEENTALRARAEAAEEAAARLERGLAQLRRKITGPSSERVVDPNQLPLPMDNMQGPEEPPPDEEDDEAPATDEKEKRKRRRRRGGRRKIEDMDHLRTIVFEEDVQDRSCPCGCDAEAVTIGHDISWRLERIPAELVRHKIVQEKVAFPGHKGEANGTVVTASCPVPYALPKAMCANGLLAQIVLDKYADHLPLHRQEERFWRAGIDLSRQTMCDWALELADLLSPIVQRMELEVRGGSWLRADATGMPVYDPKRVKGRTHHGQLWAWGNYETVVFNYTSNKKAETVVSMFDGFAGVVLLDGATDFNLLEKANGVKRAGCWAHARRYLYEALPYDSKLALRGLAAIRHLFLAERVVMAAPLAERLALRRELCQPVVDGIRIWVDEELPKQIPKTPTHAALQYIDNQWKRLVVFLETAEIACHNNDTERDLRRPVKGKANFHYARSPRGARAMAVYYSLIGTCLLQGINPRHYLLEILGRLDEPASALTPHAVREQWEADTPGE